MPKKKEENILETENVTVLAPVYGDMEDRQKRVENLMRAVFNNFLLPFKEINLKIDFDDQDKKVVAEIKKEYPELLVGGSNDYLSLPLILATITKILSGQEMRFLSDEERNISGVKFFK